MDEIQSHPFIRILLKRALHFHVFADTKKEYDEIMDNLHQITEKDILDKTPGKPFLSNGYYLECFIAQKKVF